MGSLKADSATTVWATFGRRRERTNSGIRIAGSVGDSTAPISSAAVQERSKARWATTPVTTAVRTTPGMTSMPEPDPDPAQDVEREVEPAVEEDQRDAEGEDELRAERVERHVDHVEHRRAEQGAEEHQQQDLREPAAGWPGSVPPAPR